MVSFAFSKEVPFMAKDKKVYIKDSYIQKLVEGRKAYKKTERISSRIYL